MTTRRNLLRTGTAIAGGLFVTACAGGEASAEKEIFEVTRTDAEWRKLLAPEAYAVLPRLPLLPSPEGRQLQVLTCFTGTKVLAYWYNSTNTDT